MNAVEAFFLAVVLGLIGFLLQRANNASRVSDYHDPVFNPALAWFFGVRPRLQRIYLRPAVMQLLGWGFFSGGIILALYPNHAILEAVCFLTTVVALGVAVAPLIILDLLSRRRR